MAPVKQVTRVTKKGDGNGKDAKLGAMEMELRSTCAHNATPTSDPATVPDVLVVLVSEAPSCGERERRVATLRGCNVSRVLPNIIPTTL